MATADTEFNNGKVEAGTTGGPLGFVHITLTRNDDDINVIGSRYLHFTPDRARQVAAEIVAAADKAEDEVMADSPLFERESRVEDGFDSFTVKVAPPLPPIGELPFEYGLQVVGYYAAASAEIARHTR